MFERSVPVLPRRHLLAFDGVRRCPTIPMNKDGMEYAVLGVDAENPTGAYGVYKKLGFHQLRAEVALQKKV